MCACSHVSTLSQTKDETAACHAPRVIAACYWYAARQSWPRTILRAAGQVKIECGSSAVCNETKRYVEALVFRCVFNHR